MFLAVTGGSVSVILWRRLPPSPVCLYCTDYYTVIPIRRPRGPHLRGPHLRGPHTYEGGGKENFVLPHATRYYAVYPHGARRLPAAAYSRHEHSMGWFDDHHFAVNAYPYDSGFGYRYGSTGIGTSSSSHRHQSNSHYNKGTRNCSLCEQYKTTKNSNAEQAANMGKAEWGLLSWQQRLERCDGRVQTVPSHVSATSESITSSPHSNLQTVRACRGCCTPSARSRRCCWRAK